MSLRWKIAQAFEVRWWQHYLRNKPTADYLEWKRDYWKEFLDKIKVQPRTGSSAMDVGCGPAGIFIILDNLKVDALDPLLPTYSDKLDHFEKKAYPNVNFHEIPFEKYNTEQQFDYVFCLNAINHVADLSACMDRLVAITKPGGTLVMSIDAHNYWALKTVFRMIPGDILHPHQYDLTEYRSMLTDRNCEVVNSVLYRREMIFNYFVLVARRLPVA